MILDWGDVIEMSDAAEEKFITDYFRILKRAVEVKGLTWIGNPTITQEMVGDRYRMSIAVEAYV